MKKTRIKRPVKRDDGWWIPRCPPHYFQSIGPYDTQAEAEDNRQGVLRTINSPAWRSIIEDMADEE